MDDRECRILVADDNRDIHEDIRYILGVPFSENDNYMEIDLLKEELFGKRGGSYNRAVFPCIRYTIDDAYRGDEAVNMVRAAKESGRPYSLVFMDVRMPPGIDGIETIENIWRLDPDVCIVICTAYSDYTWDQIIDKLGPNDNLLFIRKPFDSISLKQIALAMTTKWNLKMQLQQQISDLENRVRVRTRELTIVIDKLETEIALRKEKEKQLAYYAHFDVLTKLLNRHSLYLTVDAVTASGLYGYSEFSFFYIDVDDFKSVNDILGHDVGDKLLIEVAKRIRHVLGKNACVIPDFIDGKGTSYALYRIGGDEFTAFIKEADRVKAGLIAQKLVEIIKQPFHINGHEINAACCIGISTFPNDGSSMDLILKRADTALYAAKRMHGTYCFYDEGHQC